MKEFVRVLKFTFFSVSAPGSARKKKIPPFLVRRAISLVRISPRNTSSQPRSW